MPRDPPNTVLQPRIDDPQLQRAREHSPFKLKPVVLENLRRLKDHRAMTSAQLLQAAKAVIARKQRQK